MDKDVPSMVEFVTFTDIPAGFSVSFTDTDGSEVSETIPDDSYNFTISGDEDAIRASIDTITFLTPLHSDDNFTMSYYVGTASGYVHKFIHPVGVFAIADPPAIDATESILVRPGCLGIHWLSMHLTSLHFHFRLTKIRTHLYFRSQLAKVRMSTIQSI